MNYRVVGIPDAVAKEVRTTLKSPKYGHPAYAEIADGYGPCRSCLQVFNEGMDERVLFTYDSFTGIDHVPAPGPVFIHRAECQRFEDSGFPPQLRSLPLLLESYGRGSLPVSHEAVVNDDIDATIERLLALPAVDYIQIRNADAGCFMARIERVESSE